MGKISIHAFLVAFACVHVNAVDSSPIQEVHQRRKVASVVSSTGIISPLVRRKQFGGEDGDVFAEETVHPGEAENGPDKAVRNAKRCVCGPKTPISQDNCPLQYGLDNSPQDGKVTEKEFVEGLHEHVPGCDASRAKVLYDASDANKDKDVTCEEMFSITKHIHIDSVGGVEEMTCDQLEERLLKNVPSTPVTCVCGPKTPISPDNCPLQYGLDNNPPNGEVTETEFVDGLLKHVPDCDANRAKRLYQDSDANKDKEVTCEEMYSITKHIHIDSVAGVEKLTCDILENRVKVERTR
jgi:hypothetical protein